MNRPYLETGGIDGVGLLTGKNNTCTSDWSQTALLNVNNVDQLVCAIQWNLLLPHFFRPAGYNHCASPVGADEGQRRNAAAFIVMTMLGQGNANSGNNAAAACSSFPTWEARVRQYAAAGLINFNHNRSYTQNTMIHTAFLDPMWYHNSTISHVAGDTRWTNSITFRSPGGSILYSIKKDCANPIGIPGVLTNLSHNFSANPNANVTVSPGADNPQQATFVGGASYSGAPFNATIARRDFILRYGSSVEETIGLVSQTRTFTGSSYSFDDTRDISGLGLEAGDRVCARTRITPAAGTAGPDGTVLSISDPDQATPNICITIVNQPYHKVYGGDVFAGGGFGSPCYDTNARIIGFNAPNFAFFGLSVGSGTQLAAFALGTINEFGSGQIRNSLDPTNNNTKNLTFANTTAGYGGNLGDENAVCAPDFWAGASGVLTNDQTIAGRNLGNGAEETIYVEGNAHITGNVTYTGDPLSGSYNNLSSIPSFRLIVRGNIYIAPGVSELNGLFVAIPTSATNGRVYTCSNGFNPPTTGQLDSACQNNLTVYGAVIADLIEFARSGGSLRYACTVERFNVTCPSGREPAEKFIYTPEMWLTSDFSGSESLDSIKTLPPVL